MGYYIDHMIGIRTGGVFSGKTDMDDMSRRIAAIVREADGSNQPDIYVSDDGKIQSLSPELVAHKGAMVVIAGVFNYWAGEDVDWFCKRLSEEFGTEVLHMEHDEQTSGTRCNIWLDGHSLWDVNENPIGRILRRVT